MNSLRTGISPALVAVGVWVGDRAWAQNASNTPAPSPATTPGDGGGTAIAAVIVVAGLLVVIGL
ncbi:MAG: hypothetical protein DMD89_31515, partial [Candidatus Rokuibacteriota bacterium]